MSSDLDDDELTAIIGLLSVERLAALLDLTGSLREALSLHQETMNLGSKLMIVIASVELSLRNTINVNLAAFFGTPQWLTHPPAPFQWRDLENKKAQQALDNARRAKYAKLSQQEKASLDVLAFPNGRPTNLSHSVRAKRRRQQIAVSEGQVIAELTFYFWKKLYSPEYEHSLWKQSLKRTFPNTKIKRADVAINLEYIYQTRNRLAHHEPVLHKRFNEAILGIEFICANLGQPKANPASPLSKLVADDLRQVKSMADALHARLDSFRPVQ